MDLRSSALSEPELVDLVRRVFAPRSTDSHLALLVDLPDDVVPDEPRWRARRELAASWLQLLESAEAALGLIPRMWFYRNVRCNNADLPALAWPFLGSLPDHADQLDPRAGVALSQVLAEHQILLAMTQFSATAPLKLAAKQIGFRAATMPGFCAEMLPALRLDYAEVDRRVMRFKNLLDLAVGAELRFRVGSQEARLYLDLRYHPGHASSGLCRTPGTAANLPSGEAYIVPYEGERPGDPSRSAGTLPVQFADEVVFFRIEHNRAVAVESRGPQADRQAQRLAEEPAYGNLAEFGLGVLASLGLAPIGEILLDEKLGLHIAFGRSDHFGGQVGAADFSRPEAVVHIDWVYLPATQPQVSVLQADLEMPDGQRVALIRDDQYVISF